jgi:hypothetical protein
MFLSLGSHFYIIIITEGSVSNGDGFGMDKFVPLANLGL